MKARTVTMQELALGLLQLFDGGNAWTQNMLARTATGGCTKPEDEDAVRFCLVGGARRLLGTRRPQDRKAWKTLRGRILVVAGAPIEEPVTFWNDSRRNYGEVKAVLEAVLEGGK